MRDTSDAMQSWNNSLILASRRVLTSQPARAALLALAVSLIGACTTVQTVLIPTLDGTGLPGCGFVNVKSDVDCAQFSRQSGCRTYEYVPFNEAVKPPACKAFECTGFGSPSPPLPIVSTTKFCSDTITFATGADQQAFVESGDSDIAAITPAALARNPLKVASAEDVIAITEFLLPRTDVFPGPIVSAGSRLVFGSVASPCTNGPCDIYRMETDGRVAAVGATCGSPSNCRHSGLTPTADGGFCYTTVNDRYPIGPPNNGAGKPDEITCVSANGTVTTQRLDILTGFVGGLGLAVDGRILFTESRWNGIGRFSVGDPTSLRSSHYYTNGGASIGFESIAGGRDGSIWFTVAQTGTIGLLDSRGLQFFRPQSQFGYPGGIVLGPDGNMWFTLIKANKIGRITPAGVITEFNVPTADSNPIGIAAGPDGALWFTEFTGNKIGRITVFGDITEYPIPTASARPMGIAAGPDGNMWFTELAGNKIGKVTLPSSTLPQVIEFYNTNLDHYFITANPAEQAAIDSGSAGPGWSRTSSAFTSGGNSTVCRFYGSITPGPNSHFYTADANECAALKTLQATTPASQKRWNFESNDFNTTPASNGGCPAGLTPVYRAYNNGFARGFDSNHRITPSANAIAEVVARGWSSEGVVMCAP